MGGVKTQEGRGRTSDCDLRLGENGVPASVDVKAIVLSRVDDFVSVPSLHSVGLDDDHCNKYVLCEKGSRVHPGSAEA